MTIKIYDKEYPVTSKFQTEVLDVHPELASMTYQDLTHQRDELLRLSTLRYNLDVPLPKALEAGKTLTAAEQSRLDNITHVINVHNAIKFLQGRPHTDFGFDGVDQVHGNRHTAECGCIKHVVFDHHKRHATDENGEAIPLTLHDHPHPHDRVCDKHKQ